MKKWIKNKSFLFSSSLLLGILCMTLTMGMNYLSYEAQHKAIFNEFTIIGEKLQALSQANTALFEAVENGTGQAAESSELDTLKRLLNAMIDDEVVANAYYLKAETIQNEGWDVLQYIQVSDSMAEAGLQAGGNYVPSAEYYDSFLKAVSQGAVLTEDFKDNYGTWMAYLAPIKSVDGSTIALLGIEYDYDKLQSKLNHLIIKSTIIAIVVSASAISIVILLVRVIVRPLRVLVQYAKEAANGDLTIQVPNTNRNEIGQVAQSFNEMVASLRELTYRVEHTAKEVSEASFTMKETASQAESVTQDISTSIQSSAAGAESQLASAQECQRAMTEMTIGIQKIADSSSTVSELATDTSQLAAGGEAVINQTVQQMNKIEQQVTGASHIMQELNESNIHINDIIVQITEIADQTNLLALNASIEAARAGESGKGFAVVAQEIRKLAERSKESSHEIATMLQEIGTKTEAVATVLNESADETQTGSELVHASGESFRSILQAVNQVSAQVQEVSAASEQMSAGSEEIAASMVELEQMAHTSASRTQEIAAASEQQQTAIEEVSSSSQRLQSLAQQLTEALGKFKV